MSLSVRRAAGARTLKPVGVACVAREPHGGAAAVARVPQGGFRVRRKRGVLRATREARALLLCFRVHSYSGRLESARQTKGLVPRLD